MELAPKRLAVLLAVHRAAGVVAAADLLHLTPSAVSQQIRLLEKDVGMSLLIRTPHGAVLTEAGQVLAQVAERIEDELATARRELATFDDSAPTGTVRIGAIVTAVRALLVPLVSQMADTHPGVEICIEETEERSALARLRRGELDLVLLESDSQSLPTPPRGQAAVPLLDESWLIVVPPGHAAPTTLADLQRCQWIDHAPGAAGAQALERLGEHLGGRLNVRHSAYDYDLFLDMVHAGLGYALLPQLAVYNGHVPEGLSVVALPGLGQRHILARHRTTRLEPTPATAAVLDGLVAHAAALGRELVEAAS